MEASAKIDACEPIAARLERERARYSGPVLIYDMELVRRRIALLGRLGQRVGGSFLVALKAVPDSRVLLDFAAGGCGFDVSNVSEWRAAAEASRAAGARPPISVTGPLATEIAAALDAAPGGGTAVTINVGSRRQLETLPVPGPDHMKVSARIALDVPPPEGDRALVTRFGFDPSDADGLRAVARHPRFAGLHCHLAHGTNRADTFERMLDRLVAIAAAARLEINSLNLGGGLHNLPDRALLELVQRLSARAPVRVQLVFEPGRYWFRDAGFAIARVLDVRPWHGDFLVEVDLSADCHLRWSHVGLLGHDGHAEGARVLVHVFGGTCHEGDRIGSFELPGEAPSVPPLRPGALITLSNVSGYAGAWNTSFNGVAPAKVLLHGIDT